MRAYFFGNMYLSSIQQGIQAAHATADMFIKYNCTSGGQGSILEEWASTHKTMVLLNAGYSEEIRNLVKFFEHKDNPFPWAPFFEGVDALDGAITTVGIVLPEEIYNAAKVMREGVQSTPNTSVKDMLTAFEQSVWGEHKPSPWEKEMAAKLNNYGLAK